MSKLFQNIRNLKVSTWRYLNKSNRLETQQLQTSIKPNLRLHSKKETGPFGWFLLIIPASTFALGTWQVQRKKWKENLIKDLHEKKNTQPVPLPKTLEEIEALEYSTVHVKGTFLHDKEIYLGPRTLLVEGDASSNSSLISKGQMQSQGYLVITPFKLSDRDQTILINRGWVPMKNLNSKTRQSGQIPGETDVIGVVRLHENRPNFMPKNRDRSNIWYYRDLEQMSEVTGAAPIYLDATTDFDQPGSPVGGQTRISLRNEHMSYIITWYCLCAATSYMWYRQFLRPI